MDLDVYNGGWAEVGCRDVGDKPDDSRSDTPP